MSVRDWFSSWKREKWTSHGEQLKVVEQHNDGSKKRRKKYANSFELNDEYDIYSD